MLSHRSAAGLHGLEVARPAEVELTIAAADRDADGPGCRSTAPPCCIPTRSCASAGMPVSSPARVALELSPWLSDQGLARLVDQVLRRTSRARLLDTLERHPRDRGTVRLRAVLDPARPSVDTWSKAEARLLTLFRGAGVPAPEANVPVGPYTPDLLWRQERVIVEYDSLEFHSGPGSFTADRLRRNDLTTWGYQVLSVTWEMLTERPERVLVWVATALARAA